MAGKLGLAALALSAAAGLALWGGAPSPVTPAVAQEAAPAVADMVLGLAEAPVTVVEYSSFTCPHCATFENEVLAPLKRDYIDTGKVRFVFREVYFDRYGLWAAMVARCGGEMRYFGIHDMLFDQQQDWATIQDPMQVVNKLKTIGLTAGLDQASLDACLNDQAKAEALIKQSETNMAADGVTGTPTIFVNETKHSNMGWDEFKAILDAELAG